MSTRLWDDPRAVVVPLLCVVLVTFMVYMVIEPMMIGGDHVVTPQGQNLRVHPDDPNDQTLGIDKDGWYYLNRRPIRNETLAQRLAAIFATRQEDRLLYIKAHKDLPYETVREAMDIAARSGVRVVALVADQTPGTHSSVVGDEPCWPPKQCERRDR
jgi:biopolymer transport protein ExbD